MVKGFFEGKFFSNCTLRFLRLIMVGDRIGYIGRVIYISGYIK